MLIADITLQQCRMHVHQYVYILCVLPHNGWQVTSHISLCHLSGNIAGTCFYYRLSQMQGHSVAGRVMSLKTFNDNIGNRIWDLPACGAVRHRVGWSTAPVVFYGCETWSLTLRDERRLRLLGNRKLRLFGPSRYEVTGEWRKLNNEELNDLYCPPNIFRVIKMRWAGHVARMGERESVYRVLVGKPEGQPTWETQA